MRIHNLSVLSTASVGSVDNVVFWKSKALPEVPFRDDDIYYQFIENDRLDKVSYRFYNTPNCNWFIALTNNVKLESEIENGTVLRIPSYISLIRYLSDIK